MACDGYNKKSLMGNWWEDRQAFPQKCHEDPAVRIVCVPFFLYNNLNIAETW